MDRRLRQIVSVAHIGITLPLWLDVTSACRSASDSDVTCYAKPKKYGGWGKSRFAEMKDLNKIVAGLGLDRSIVMETVDCLLHGA